MNWALWWEVEKVRLVIAAGGLIVALIGLAVWQLVRYARRGRQAGAGWAGCR